MLPFLRNVNGLSAWLLVALSDLAVTVPWIILLYRGVTIAQWQTAIPGVWLALLVYAAASLWEAGDRGNAESARRRRLAAMGAGVAGAYLAAYFLQPAAMQTGLLSGNPAWAYVPAAAYLWYQGTLAVTEGLDYNRLSSRFPWQIVGMAAGIVFLIQLGGAADPGIRVLLYWSVILLLAAGLLGLIFARERQLRAGQASIGEKGTGSGRQSRVIAFSVIVLLLLTLAASYILSAERMGAIATGAAGAVWGALRWLAAVVYLILYRFILLLGPILTAWYNWMRAQIMKKPPQEPVETKEGEPEPDYLQYQDDVYAIETWMPYLQAALIAAFVIALAVYVYRLERRRRKVQYAEEEIIDLGLWSNLWADLKSLFQPGPAATGGVAAPAEELDPGDPRLLFRRLQAWGARAGRPRHESETPNAYRGALGALKPERVDAVNTVTAVYNQARYGAAAPPAGSVAAAREAVAGLEAGEDQKES